MKPIKKILVGVDMTPGSLSVLRRAAHWGKDWGSSVAALHVLPELPYQGAGASTSDVELMSRLEEDAEQGLEKMLKELNLDSASLELEVQTGVPFRDLVKQALKMPADLLLVGSESKKGLEGIFLGSTTEAVVRKSLVPTWVERLGKSGEIKRVLIPTDLSENSRSAIVAGLEWVQRLKVEALFLHVGESPYIPTFSLIDTKDYQVKMQELATRHFKEFLAKLPLEGITHESALVLGSPAAEIARVAKEKKCDFILIGTHGYTGLNYHLLGSVAAKVLRHAQCHLLFLRPSRLNFSWLKKELEG